MACLPWAGPCVESQLSLESLDGERWWELAVTGSRFLKKGRSPLPASHSLVCFAEAQHKLCKALKSTESLLRARHCWKIQELEPNWSWFWFGSCSIVWDLEGFKESFKSFKTLKKKKTKTQKNSQLCSQLESLKLFISILPLSLQPDLFVNWDQRKWLATVEHCVSQKGSICLVAFQ